MSINDLGLFDDELPEVNRDDMPIMAPYVTPQPGTYVFQLPAFAFGPETSGEVLDKLIEKVNVAGGGQRIAIKFEGEHALKLGSDKYRARMSNVERTIRKQVVNDLAYLAHAIGFQGSLRTNKEYAEMVLGSSLKRFKATVEYQARCRPDADIYGPDGQPIPGVKGCGHEYRQRAYKRKDGRDVFQIPREPDGKWPERFPCQCGASLRAFPTLTAIRPIE